MTQDEAARAAEVFKALGHPTRVRLVAMLLSGERCVCELRAAFECDLSVVSKHLSVLKHAGVVGSRRDANKILYRIEMPCVAQMLERCEKERF